MLIAGATFGKWLDHESKAFRNGVRKLIKETPESFLTISARWEQSKKTALSMNQEAGSHQTPNQLMPWSWIFLSPELRDISVYCIIYPVNGFLL